MEKIETKKILELFSIDRDRISQGKRRQEEVWLNREPDFIPVILDGSVLERERFPRYNMRERAF